MASPFHRVLVTGGSKAGKSRWINESVLREPLLWCNENRAPVLFDVVHGPRPRCTLSSLEEGSPRLSLGPLEYQRAIEELADLSSEDWHLIEWVTPRLARGVVLHERPLEQFLTGLDEPPADIILLVPHYGLDRTLAASLEDACSELRSTPVRRIYLVSGGPGRRDAGEPHEVRTFLQHHLGTRAAVLMAGPPPVEEYRAR